jgi:hypothetical protein
MLDSAPWALLLVILFAGFVVADSARRVRALLTIIGWTLAGNVLGVVIGLVYGFPSSGAARPAELASLVVGIAASIECMRRNARARPASSRRASQPGNVKALLSRS